MGTIRLKTNQHRLISNLRHAFNPQSMLVELLQNARRAGAKHVNITVDDDAITVCDDGSGIADLQSLTPPDRPSADRLKILNTITKPRIFCGAFFRSRRLSGAGRYLIPA